MNLDGFTLTQIVIAPYLLKQPLSGEHHIGILRQKQQQFKLPVRELDFQAVFIDLAAARQNLQRPYLQDFFLMTSLSGRLSAWHTGSDVL